MTGSLFCFRHERTSGPLDGYDFHGNPCKGEIRKLLIIRRKESCDSASFYDGGFVRFTRYSNRNWKLVLPFIVIKMNRESHKLRGAV